MIAPVPRVARSGRSGNGGILLWILPLLGCSVAGSNPGESSVLQTNLQVIQGLAENVANEVSCVLRTVSDTVSVTIHPKEKAWYLEVPFLHGLGEDLHMLTGGEDAPLAAEFAVNSVDVHYGQARKSSILGTTVVDRKIAVGIAAKVVNNRTGVVLLAREFNESRVDTVEISRIRDIENPNIPVTQASLPAQGFFTNLVEPLIVLAAIGVAVFLLFHVRS